MDPVYKQSFNKEESLGALNTLNRDVISLIMARLSLADLGRLACASKGCAALADRFMTKRRIYKEYAFGKAQWARYFGREAVKEEHRKNEYKELPRGIKERLRSPCPFNPGKSIGATHLLIRLPAGLSLNKMGELVKPYFPKTTAGYRYYWTCIENILGYKPLEKSVWVLVGKETWRGDFGQSYKVQEIGVKSDSCQVAEVLPFVTSIFVKTVLSQDKSKVFNQERDHFTYAFCKEDVYGFHVIVGGYGAEGLAITREHFGGKYEMAYQTSLNM